METWGLGSSTALTLPLAQEDPSNYCVNQGVQLGDSGLGNPDLGDQQPGPSPTTQLGSSVFTSTSYHFYSLGPSRNLSEWEEGKEPLNHSLSTDYVPNVLLGASHMPSRQGS